MELIYSYLTNISEHGHPAHHIQTQKSLLARLESNNASKEVARSPNPAACAGELYNL